MGVCLKCKHDPCMCDQAGDEMPKPPNEPAPPPEPKPSPAPTPSPSPKAPES